jgi:ABC-2 type transport system permease protein
MQKTLAVMQRELLALFCSPIGFVVIAGFLLVTGITFATGGGLGPGKPATLRVVFGWTPIILAIVLPAVSMRLLSEEYRSGTVEMLLTAPISEGQVVLGKFLAALAFYATMLLSSVIFFIILAILGTPDWGAAVATYLGLLLVGMTFLSVGLLASASTGNQIVAWMLSAVPLMVFVWFGPFIQPAARGILRQVVQQIDIYRHVDQFNRGLITAESVVMFVAITALFLFVSVKVVESRRWR